MGVLPAVSSSTEVTRAIISTESQLRKEEQFAKVMLNGTSHVPTSKTDIVRSKQVFALSSNDQKSIEALNSFPQEVEQNKQPLPEEHVQQKTMPYNQLLSAMVSLQMPRSVPSSRRSSIIPDQDIEKFSSRDLTREELLDLVQRCCKGDSSGRPDFSSLRTAVKDITDSATLHFIVNSLLICMEKYANNLEKIVEERTMDCFLERKRTEDLLYKLLPKSICTRLVHGQAVIAE